MQGLQGQERASGPQAALVRATKHGPLCKQAAGAWRQQGGRQPCKKRWQGAEVAGRRTVSAGAERCRRVWAGAARWWVRPKLEGVMGQARGRKWGRKRARTRPHRCNKRRARKPQPGLAPQSVRRRSVPRRQRAGPAAARAAPRAAGAALSGTARPLLSPPGRWCCSPPPTPFAPAGQSSPCLGRRGVAAGGGGRKRGFTAWRGDAHEGRWAGGQAAGRGSKQ